MNLRGGEDDRERLALLDAYKVAVEQLTRTLTTSEATANANRFLFYFYRETLITLKQLLLNF